MDISFKVVLVGDSFVGKTCMICRAVADVFQIDSGPTLGVSYSTKEVTTTVGPVTLQVWDTAGQEKYRSIAPMYYRDADLAIVVFSLTDEKSYINIDNWIKDIRHNAPSILLLIAGNKSDLHDQIQVNFDEISQKLNDFGIEFMSVSAATGYGIEELFIEAAETILKSRTPGELNEMTPGKHTKVPLTQTNKKSCC